MIKESASIKTALFLTKDWSRNLNLQNNWAAMYTLNFQLCLGSFDSEPPHCKILLFFKSFGNKRTIHHLSGEPGSNPYSCIAGVFWKPALTVSGKKSSWAKTWSSGGGTDQTMQRAALAKPQESVCACSHVCVCARGLQTNLFRDQYGLWMQLFHHTTLLLSWLWGTDDNWIHCPWVGST